MATERSRNISERSRNNASPSPLSASSVTVVLSPAEKLAPLLGPARTDSEVGRRITAGTAALLIANEPASMSPRKAVAEETKISSKFGFTPSVIPPGRNTPTLADNLEGPPGLQPRVSFAPPESITPRHVASRNTPGGITDHITPGGDFEPEASRRPQDTNFKQQRLKNIRPLLVSKHLLIIYFVFGGLFLPIGLGILAAQFQLVEVEHRYDETCGNPCNVSLVIPHDIDPPIFVHYKIYGFYQNHRRYVKSRSEDQLTGKDITRTTGCDGPDSVVGGKVLYPCGYIANSFFNDSFSAQYCPVGGNGACQRLEPNTDDWAKDIVWTDDYKRFKEPSDPSDLSLVTRIAADGPPHILPNVTDEDFMVWMRPSGFPNFRKLYRKINRPMTKGDVIMINITNQFPVTAFNGDKAIAISTVNWFGGKNSFIAWIYVGISILFIGGGFIMLALEKIFPRRIGDMRYFYWSETNPKYD